MKEKPIGLTILNFVSVILLGISLYMSLVFAPVEVNMGNVQRIFYTHVSVGWLGMIGFLLALVAGILYLVTGKKSWDIIGVAGVEVGLVFCLLNIISGSVWAKATWNTWWIWEPRLITATIMELIYIAYIMLRQSIDEPDRRARFGAIYAIVGFISVPLTFLSIRIWNTIHPVVIASGDAGADSGMNMTDNMQKAFFFALFTFTVIGVTLLWHRIRLGFLSDKIEQLKMKMVE
jgi:heme exporter protein C